MRLPTAVVAVIALTLFGCATRDEARREAAPAATATVQGVHVFAQAAWPGEPGVVNYATPLHLVVENNGTQALRLQYRFLRLVGQDGTTHAAIPPFPIAGGLDFRGVDPLARGPVSLLAERPLAQAGFVSHGFDVAPFYASLYPTLRQADPVGYGPLDYYNYYEYWNRSRHWNRSRLPTGEMLYLALPEGVLHPGGRASGYVYFETVRKELPQVSLRANLVSQDAGDLIGTVEIPLALAER